MTKMIFVNLPVADLAASRAFYEAIGFSNEPRFTSDGSAMMRWSEAIAVMLTTHERWRDFTARPIPPRGTTQVGLTLAIADRDAIDGIVACGVAAGGIADVNPSEDHGFMISRSIADPDDHLWDMMWMDPAVASGETAVPGVDPAAA